MIFRCNNQKDEVGMSYSLDESVWTAQPAMLDDCPVLLKLDSAVVTVVGQWNV